MSLDKSERIWASGLAAAIAPTIPRVAFVSGAARRIGRAVALALAQAGFAVAVHCRQGSSDAERTASEIRDCGVASEVITGNLSRETESTSMVERATNSLGPVGVLVNNASTFERDAWDTASPESWARHMDTNLRAPFMLVQQFAKWLPVGAEGVVINMLDARVWAPTGQLVSYSVSKSGLWALTQSLAIALAPRIRVNGIGPGPALPSTLETTEAFERDSASLPLRRGTGPAEIGRAVLSILALPSMTGQMLALDGGQHLAYQTLGLDGAPTRGS